MYPPIFEIASADASVKTALGENPTRFFPFGQATDGTTQTYAVWQVVGGAPENYLSNRPVIDLFRIQIDVYGDSASEVRTAAMALRNVLEGHAHVVSWRGESRDPQTGRYRSSFDMDFWTNR